jgi:polyvinyl alcohol dehydrogenase (cytochrome)
MGERRRLTVAVAMAAIAVGTIGVAAAVPRSAGTAAVRPDTPPAGGVGHGHGGPGDPNGPPVVPPGHGGPNPGQGHGPPPDGGTGGPSADQATSQLACPAWSMYGRTLGREFSTDCPSPIDRGSVGRLVPAWTFDTPRPVTATPAVVDGVVYVGSWDAIMWAFDAETGAVRWQHQSPPATGATYGPIVSSAAVADVASPAAGTRRLVIFGSGPRVYALDAIDGSEVWVHDASGGAAGSPTEYESSPVVHGGLVLIGRDTHDEDASQTGGVRGGLVALDILTGEVRWTFEPEQDQPGTGCGGIWGSPVIDPQLGYAFVGAANCPHADSTWTRYTNAVTAVDLETGSPVWSFRPNEPPDDDTDFGATPNLFVDSTGRRVLGAGKKDGTYYALDPATGRLLWSTHLVDPAPNIGGFIGSPAVYGGYVFGGTAIGSPSFFHSLDGATGAVRWEGGVGPTYGATAVVNGVAFNAALDDLLKAYDTDTGQILWTTPLSGPGSSGPAIYEDMVFIGSGTSTSDACGKDNVYDQACFFAFDTALATLGGVHAYRLAPVGEIPAPPTFDGPRLPELGIPLDGT